MSVFYRLNQIEECLAAEYEECWINDEMIVKMRILDQEFYKLLRAAIEVGRLKLYSEAGRQISPGELGGSLKQSLSREEFSNWLKENLLPYSLPPERFKPQTLLELQKNGELRDDCIDIVKNLKARGFPEERIDKRKVATELSKTVKYHKYKEDTIFQRIRRFW